MSTIFDPNQLISSISIAEQLPLVGIELIKQFTHCSLTAYKNPDYDQDAQSGNGNSGSPEYLAGWASSHQKGGRVFVAGDQITQTQANELLQLQLQNSTLPILNKLPGWDSLNEHQRGALISFAHSLDNDSSVLSPRSLLGRALKDRRWYQIPAIIRGYYGPNATAHIAERRHEEADLFLLEMRPEQYTVMNRSRLLELTDPALRGQDINRLQKALGNQGYEIDVDGIFGPLTQWAVEKYQTSVGLPSNGVADQKTQRILYARALYLSEPYLMGSDVRETQSLLGRIGYSVDVDGVFNLRTWQAVVAFQRYFSLPEDGIIQGKTLTKLLHLPVLETVL